MFYTKHSNLTVYYSLYGHNFSTCSFHGNDINHRHSDDDINYRHGDDINYCHSDDDINYHHGDDIYHLSP